MKSLWAFVLVIGLLAIAVGAMAAEAAPAGVPRPEAACVQGSGDPSAAPTSVYSDCGAAVDFFRNMKNTAAKADEDFISLNIGLFEIYQAHAADAIRLGGRADMLRADAKRIWKELGEHSASPRVRQQAKVSSQCFFANNAAACQKAFSAGPNGF